MLQVSNGIASPTTISSLELGLFRLTVIGRAAVRRQIKKLEPRKALAVLAYE